MTQPFNPAVASGSPSLALAVTASQTAAGGPLAGLTSGNRSVPPALRPSAPADPARLRKAAQDFEAMAIGQFLQPMFDTVDTAHTLFGGGDGETTWKPMLIQEFGKLIAAHGGLGLAEPVYAAMLRMQEAPMQPGGGS
jgi:peptidoglycan hydrolase FlgJ